MLSFRKHDADGRVAVAKGDRQLMLGDRAALLQDSEENKAAVRDVEMRLQQLVGRAIELKYESAQDIGQRISDLC